MTAPRRIALVAVTKGGLEQARRLRSRLRVGEVHRPEQLGPAEHGWERPFQGSLSGLVPQLFPECEQIVFFLAVGAVTRLIAPCLGSKTTDPGVLAVDETARFVVPVLSGHQGGANAFARVVAGCLGAVPVVTTASDVIGGLSLDLLEQAHGWTAEPAAGIKPTSAALVNGEPVALVQELGTRGSWLDQTDLPPNVHLVTDAATLSAGAFARTLYVTDRFVPIAGSEVLWLRPRSLRAWDFSGSSDRRPGTVPHRAPLRSTEHRGRRNCQPEGG